MIWYVSCPFPAITTTSPARPQATAASMARRRSAMDTCRPAASAGMPVSISARIASGRSVRGLSEVTQAKSAERAPRCRP